MISNREEENEEDETGPELEEYKIQAEALKDQGNEAFQAGNTDLAIAYFSNAIDIDPDNHVYYSNRSAAYMKADSKSKALKDAEKCVELAPTWSKGYSRLGAAQQSLKRFDAAIDNFKKGIELDPNNKTLWAALKACEAAFAADKKHRFAAAEDELKKEIAEERERQISTKPDPAARPVAADDGSGGGAAGADAETDKKAENTLTEKYVTQDLGDGRAQVERLTGPHYEWKNLNPYNVFQEDIKYRYKKLSLKVHPDRMRHVEKAREAFEERSTIILHVENAVDEAKKERRKLIRREDTKHGVVKLETWKKQWK
eukprot:gene35329-45751_t